MLRVGSAQLELTFFVVELAAIHAIIECTAASQVKGYPGLVRHFLGPTWGTMFSGVIATYCFFAGADETQTRAHAN